MTTFITDKDGDTIDASGATIPSDRHFRNAWKINGSVISEDLDTAKEIFKDKIREVRKPLLEAEDVTYMKAMEAAAASASSPCPLSNSPSLFPTPLKLTLQTEKSLSINA